jgi:hypothetical protein
MKTRMIVATMRTNCLCITTEPFVADWSIMDIMSEDGTMERISTGADAYAKQWQVAKRPREVPGSAFSVVL